MYENQNKILEDINKMYENQNYFKDLRAIGNRIDDGIYNLQETWKMPHLLLCKSNEKDQTAAENLVKNLKCELNIFKLALNDKLSEINRLQEIQTQFLDESVEAMRILKEEVEDTKILFAENGYVEEPIDHTHLISNDEIESSAIHNNDSFVKNSDVTETSVCENSILYNSATNNVSVDSLQKSLLNKQPIKPVYSPYYYELME